MRHRHSVEPESLVGLGFLGCLMIVVIFNILMGPITFQYCLWSILGKDIHWLGDLIIGLFACEVTVPLAFVCFILRLFGVEVPFVH